MESNLKEIKNRICYYFDDIIKFEDFDLEKFYINKCIINMESNLKEIKNRICYYFDDIIKFKDFDLDNILLDEK